MEVKIVVTNEPDSRPLKELLDEIDYEASSLGYIGHMTIQANLAEIWRRYGDQQGEEETE